MTFIAGFGLGLASYAAGRVSSEGSAPAADPARVVQQIEISARTESRIPPPPPAVEPAAARLAGPDVASFPPLPKVASPVDDVVASSARRGDAPVIAPPPAVLAMIESDRLGIEPDRQGHEMRPDPSALGLVHGATSALVALPRKALLEVAPAAEVQIVVEAGDTLMDILLDAGIGRTEAHAAVEALDDVYDPRKLRIGQNLSLTSRSQTDALERTLLGLSFDISFDEQVRLARHGDGLFASETVERPQRRSWIRKTAEIESSLYLAAARNAVPRDVLMQLIKLFSWDVDFQRQIRAGDSFETVFEEVALRSDPDAVRGGDIAYASLELSGQIFDAYRFKRSDGTVDYYDATGRSLRKFLLRTPVDGARMSSGFGMRRHPILGYSRMHKGVDFAAPSGTPIYAAGSGRITVAGRKGGYGNYIQIRHTDTYSTAYAHMKSFARGIRSGTTVRQGQVIGYVGTTGRSTGPHLHYEVLKGGTQINPLNIEQPALAQLGGDELVRFNKAKARIDRMRADLSTDTRLASRSDTR